MPIATPYITPRPLVRLAGCVVAASVAWMALTGSTVLQDAAAPDAAVPTIFGWQRLVTVHVLLTLPACVCLAVWGAQRIPPPRRRAVTLLAAATGAAVAALAWHVMPQLAGALEAERAGFITRLLVRVVVCGALELPWCVAVEAWAGAGAHPLRATVDWPRGVTIAWTAIALVAGVALPAAYAVDLVRRQTVVASELLERQQLVAAERVVYRLCAIGSFRPVAGGSPTAIQDRLAKSISALESQLRSSTQLGVSSDAASRIEQARLLAMLDRGDEARELLRPVAATNAQAALLLAAILQQQHDWQESSHWYQTSTEMLQAEPESAVSRAGRVRAVNGIAYNAREVGQYAEAEAAYLEGLRDIPSAAAHFHFQLGRHYQQGGRPLNAVDHLRTAAELAPAAYAQQAAALLKQLAAESPGCVLGSGVSVPGAASGLKQ